MSREVVYIVGAGLSAGLGFPTIADLLPKLWSRVVSKGWDSDLAAVIRFHHPDFNASRRETFPNIETLLSELDANVNLFGSSRVATGKFTYDRLLEIQQNILLEVSGWFHDLMPPRPPDWLKRLVKVIREEEACVISFNYDLILDRWLFGDELDASSYGFGGTGGVRLLKPHGSLNWFRRESGSHIKKDRKFQLGGAGAGAVDVFRRFRAPISKVDRCYMPVIVPPVFSKKFEVPVFDQLWRKVVTAVSTASEVKFLGYSLPSSDFHARFVLRCGFFNQESGVIRKSGMRASATGRAAVTVVNPSREVARRIEQVVGFRCEACDLTIEDWMNL